MKKLLLFGLALGMVLCAYPQKVYKSNKEFAKNNTEIRADVAIYKSGSEFQPNAAELNSNYSVELDRYELGVSGNIYSVLTSYQRCLAYEPITGTLLGAFRADPATYPAALGSGTIMAHTSADDGMNWNHTIVLNTETAVHANRYPSGVLYNHEGMAGFDDLYPVVAGPTHTNGTWDYTYYATSKIDESNASDYFHPWASENDWARSSMTTVPGAVYNFGQDYTNIGSLGVDQTMKQYVGTTDDPATGFTWEINEYMPDWLIDPADGHAVALYTTWSAWSADGSIGYMWMVGVSNDSYDYGVYQPQVAFTQDGGSSWTDIEVNLEDNETLVMYLPPYQDAGGVDQTVRPTFLTGDRTYPGVVDYEGNLHLFSNVYGSSRGDVLDPDNGYWITNGITGGHIFDFVINQTGVQDVIFVDSVMKDVAPDNAFGDVSWDHRLQASKSVDEQVVFAVWCDDTDDTHTEVLNPDIKGWGYVIPDEFVLETQNFTGEDLYAGFYFFHYLSELTPKYGDFYNLPISSTLTITEYNVNDPLAPATTTYLSGLGWTYVGIDDNSAANATDITVGQNVPNPATGNTSIEISSSTVAPVTVEVSNMIGQTVQTVNAGVINGTMKVNLDVSNLEAGVYFYTVTIANERVSNRMIVR